jgi:hypothetical protein
VRTDKAVEEGDMGDRMGERVGGAIGFCRGGAIDSAVSFATITAQLRRNRTSDPLPQLASVPRSPER